MARNQRSGVIIGALPAVGLLSAGSVGTLAAPWQIHKQPLPQGANRGLTTARTELRQGPSGSAPVLRPLPKDLSIAVFGTRDGFCAVQLRNGKQGWVSAGTVRTAPPLPGNDF